MSDTIPAIEQGSVVISPEHVRELRVLLGEVRKQQYAPATCGHNNNAAVELAGYLRALLGPELTPQSTCQVPGLVEAGFSRFDGVPSEVLGCVQSFVLDGRDQSELAV
jgi:hypothetical protein